ncbi:MAG: hypothetical protein ACREQ3_27315, partial [Candidatus Binatia bacterium]
MGSTSRNVEADQALAARIAEAILDCLRENDRSINWLAGKINVSSSTLYAQLNQRPENIPYITVIRIAEALREDISRFIPAG